MHHIQQVAYSQRFRDSSSPGDPVMLIDPESLQDVTPSKQTSGPLGTQSKVRMMG
jgi:hypothetical protein